MSSEYRKIEFETQGHFGSTDKEFLYIRYNASSDLVDVYDQRGNHLFTFDEWGDFDMGKALVVALTNFEDKRLLPVSNEEFKKVLEIHARNCI